MRKNFTLIAFNLVTALATAAGVTLAPETATEYAEALVTVGGGAWVIINGFLIKRRLAKAPAVKSDVGSALGLVLALLIVGGGLTACASRFGETDLQKMAGIEKDFTMLQEQVLTLFDSGVLPDDAKNYVKKLEAAAYQAKEKAWEAALKGDSTKTAAAISLAKSAVDEALSYIKQSNWLQNLKSKATVSTGPPPLAYLARVPLTVLED